MATIKKAIFVISLALLIAAAGCTQAPSDETADSGALGEIVVQTPESQEVISTPQAQVSTPQA